MTRRELIHAYVTADNQTEQTRLGNILSEMVLYKRYNNV